MKAIDFRFRPNTPDAVDGLIHSPFFGDMCAFFNYPDRACRLRSTKSSRSWTSMKSPGSSPGATSKRPMAAPVPTWASWK